MNEADKMGFSGIFSVDFLLNFADDKVVGSFAIWVVDFEVIAKIAECVSVETHGLSEDCCNLLGSQLLVPFDHIIDVCVDFGKDDYVIFLEQVHA